MYETSEPDRKLRGVIVYSNLRRENLLSFRKDMKFLFNIHGQIKKGEIHFKSLKICRFLLSMINPTSREWSIPRFVMKGKREVKIEWIKPL